MEQPKVQTFAVKTTFDWCRLVVWSVGGVMLGAGCAAPKASAPVQASAAEASGLTRSFEIFDQSQVDQIPVAVAQARPVYPARLREAGVEGSAVVDFVVGPDGRVYDAYPIRAAHPDLGAAATAAVAQWRFRPGRVGGKAVGTHMQVPIGFEVGPVSPIDRGHLGDP